MKAGKSSETKLPIFKKFENSLTQRFGKHSIPRKLMEKNMYIENALLRESRQFSKAKNKYTTNMLENSSLAEQFMNSRKSEESFRAKENKIGILTPLSTTRFENTDLCNPDSIDPRLKTLSAAGMATSSNVQLIYKELGNHRKFTKTEMGRPNLKLLYAKDPNNKTLKAIQNISNNLNKLNQCRSISSQRDLNK